MRERLRGAIIGCGFFGQIQVEAWRRIPEVELVAACDLAIERARKCAPVAYSCAEEMLEKEKLDFVDIATRPESHLALVRLAARHGLAVICQKPMAPNWEEALAMVRVAEEAGIRLMIHENWRWQPWYREVRRRIEAGEIGHPVSYLFRVRQKDGLGSQPYPNQPYFVKMPRLLIYETLVHHIDTARFLFGEIEWIYARARRVNPIIAGEDQASLVLAHESRLQGVIDGHRFSDPEPKGPAMGEAYFEGDRGVLVVRATGDVHLGNTLVWRNVISQGYRGDSVLATQRHFIDCLRTGKPFETEAREYLKTFAAVEAAYESIESGCAARPGRWFSRCGANDRGQLSSCT